jgi:hypothetical protein
MSKTLNQDDIDNIASAVDSTCYEPSYKVLRTFPDWSGREGIGLTLDEADFQSVMRELRRWAEETAAKLDAANWRCEGVALSTVFSFPSLDLDPEALDRLLEIESEKD